MAEKLILKELCRYHVGTFADIVYRNALLHADREAFVYGAQRVTFAQYNARVNSVIHGLKAAKVKKGDVIGILAWNCLEFVDVYGAAMKGGYIASPFNPRLNKEELEYIVNYSKAHYALCRTRACRDGQRLTVAHTQGEKLFFLRGLCPEYGRTGKGAEVESIG